MLDYLLFQTQKTIMNNYTFFNVKEYFAPIPRLERWLNPYKPLLTTKTNTGTIQILVTHRAKKQLASLSSELYIEMQLMYSCILKKRTIFHDKPEYKYKNIGHKINICFRAIQPTSCDPEEFAKNYPEKRELETVTFPKKLFLDYKNNQWQGYFEL